jgi:hypothetical protein
MDFDLSPGQRDQFSTLDEVIDACGGIDRARQLARDGAHDAKLDAKLAASGLLESATLLDRVLIAERLAGLGVATTFGLRAVVTADDEVRLPDGPLAVLDSRRNGPVRYGSVATAVVVLDGDRLRICEAGDADIEPVPSSFGFGYARVHAVGEPSAIPAEVVRHRWRLALAAEIAGTAAGGIAHTAAHLRVHEQFGQSLSTFQALRHRLAEASVSAEATRWMTREAAWSGNERAALMAASYAVGTAAALATELTQMCGARAFTHEFGLHVYTMRLEGLRLELGGPDRIAVELAATHAG